MTINNVSELQRAMNSLTISASGLNMIGEVVRQIGSGRRRQSDGSENWDGETANENKDSVVTTDRESDINMDCAV